MTDLMGRPGDRRNFVHKRIFGAVKGFAGGLLSGGNPLTGAIGGFASGGGSAPAPVPGSRLITSTVAEVVGRTFGAAGCPPGFFRAPDGSCKVLFQPAKPGALAFGQRVIPGGATGRTEFGAAVLEEQFLTIGQVMGLEVGNTMMLNSTTETSVKLRCGGVSLLQGKMGRVGSHVAVNITHGLSVEVP